MTTVSVCSVYLLILSVADMRKLIWSMSDELLSVFLSVLYVSGCVA